jgi:hypothetical protein
VPKSEDIQTLFRRFGGDADSYQEIVSTDQALAAEQNWPMLGQLKTRARGEAPPARRAVLASGERKSQTEVLIYQNAPRAGQSATETLAPVFAQVAVEPGTELPVQLHQASASPVHAYSVQATHSTAAASLAGAGAPQMGLKAVFDRMLPTNPEFTPPPAPRGLKRLVKW